MKTNALNFNVSKKIIFDGKPSTIYVKIRLNDQCKNGHQDFAITGDIYSNQTSNKADRYHVTGGCIHEHILKYFSEFKIFIDLHLCDYTGVPMHAVANGMYHIKTGFDRLEGKTQKECFCEYYRVTGDQYESLLKAENQLEYTLLLNDLGVLKQWQEQANRAILKLEKLTNSTLLIDGKSQYKQPTENERQDHEEKKKSGFYSIEAKKERTEAEAKAKREKIVSNLEKEAQKKINKIQTELNLMLFLLKKRVKIHVGKYINLSIDNVIYYDHTNKLTFNWLDYKNKLTEKEFDKFCESLNETDFNNLPNGITFELKGVKIYTR
tara:strand:+ start:16298 stop:17266 length:969 start_codon:yes stop_codon:yes gene_type:complete